MAGRPTANLGALAAAIYGNMTNRLGMFEEKMETIFDWLTVIIFAGLAVLYLQRSAMDEPSDSIAHYVPPAIGCALANWLGNNGYALFGALLCVAVLAYIVHILKPFPSQH